MDVVSLSLLVVSLVCLGIGVAFLGDCLELWEFGDDEE